MNNKKRILFGGIGAVATYCWVKYFALFLISKANTTQIGLSLLIAWLLLWYWIFYIAHYPNKR